MSSHRQIAIIGLGYVGLPLAIKFANYFSVVGYDVKEDRVEELRRGYDRTGEVASNELQASHLRLTTNAEDMIESEVFIVTVPTPVDDENRPDLYAVCRACRTIGTVLRKGAIVVIESTVYPGVTEEICGPEIEHASGLRSGRDFYLGYSPERINPGDREHTVDRLTKVVAGQTPDVAQRLSAIYGAINGGRIFVAKNIRTAEAAKVIENAQRDINIAFINEVTQIFHRLDLSIYDVLDASRTKWNFLPFTPGLVGGHCIGVDPYYLADLAQRIGHDPQVILAGRRMNDGMGTYVADRIAAMVPHRTSPPRRALVLGLTFKENVPDLRNSKVVDVIRGLHRHGIQVDVHDPLVDAAEALVEYGLSVLANLPQSSDYDIVVGAVAHESYRALSERDLGALLRPQGLVVDIKGMWRREPSANIRYWRF